MNYKLVWSFKYICTVRVNNYNLEVYTKQAEMFKEAVISSKLLWTKRTLWEFNTCSQHEYTGDKPIERLQESITKGAGECQFAAVSFRLRFGCWYFDKLDRMCNQPIEIGFHIQ